MISEVRKSARNKYGIYVHVPYCKAKCAYCAFVSGCDFGSQKQYVAKLLDDISKLRDKNVYADTVYIGGGTPSTLYRGAIESIIGGIRDNTVLSDNAEITVEANPESCDVDFVDEIKAAGANRVSVGLQSADDAVLSKIGRVHTTEDFLRAVKLLKERGIDNISSDIILGLPEAGIKDVVTAVTMISELCSHVSMYALTVEAGTPLYKSGYAPDDDIVADMYETACEILNRNGFKRYEVSNFARDGRESRHNIKYWTMQPYIGIGAAAHGYDGDRTRFANTDNVTEYIAGKRAVEIKLSDKDLYNEYIMLALRTERGVDTKDFLSRFGYDFRKQNAEMLSAYIKKGVVIDDGAFVRISPSKMFVMNAVIEDFMLD